MGPLDYAGATGSDPKQILAQLLMGGMGGAPTGVTPAAPGPPPQGQPQDRQAAIDALSSQAFSPEPVVKPEGLAEDAPWKQGLKTGLATIASALSARAHAMNPNVQQTDPLGDLAKKKAQREKDRTKYAMDVANAKSDSDRKKAFFKLQDLMHQEDLSGTQAEKRREEEAHAGLETKIAGLRESGETGRATDRAALDREIQKMRGETDVKVANIGASSREAAAEARATAAGVDKAENRALDKEHRTAAKGIKSSMADIAAGNDKAQLLASMDNPDPKLRKTPADIRQLLEDQLEVEKLPADMENEIRSFFNKRLEPKLKEREAADAQKAIVDKAAQESAAQHRGRMVHDMLSRLNLTYRD